MQGSGDALGRRRVLCRCQAQQRDGIVGSGGVLLGWLKEEEGSKQRRYNRTEILLVEKRCRSRLFSGKNIRHRFRGRNLRAVSAYRGRNFVCQDTGDRKESSKYDKLEVAIVSPFFSLFGFVHVS